MDTGIGIPESKQRQLFQPFTQADTSTTRHYGGTGLGLAICKRLVELLGGRIGLESVMARGSTFWFTLPVAQSAVPAPSLLPNPDEFSGRRILLLHPYPLARAMVGAQLQSWKIDVASADKAEDAARILRIASETNQPFDLVLATLDLQQSLAQDLAAQHGAVAVLSRNSQRAEVRRLLGQGLHAQLQTPVVRPLALAAALRAGLRAVAGRASLESRRIATQQAQAATSERPVTRYRVLLADDNIVNQKLAVKMLEKLGCSVDLACNGREAVELAQQLPYDLIFMDCHMPEMDGFEATAEIRRHSASERRIPIVAVTADALAGDREKCLNAGMDGYISKPIKRDDLSRALEQWCATTVCK
jgi:CheY-like chemotaxis protein